MTFSSLISVILVATTAVASPLIFERDDPTLSVHSIPLKTSFKTNSGGFGVANNIIARDRARLNVIMGQRRNSTNSPIFAQLDASVPIPQSAILPIVEVQVGNDTYQLMVDSGSSNTFIGANKSYAPSSNSKDTGNAVSVTYGSGSFSGEEFTDDVTIGGVTCSSQSIGVANQSQGFFGLDGILGIGPDATTNNTLVNKPGVLIPTLTDCLAAQRKAASDLVGISIPLSSGSGDNTGSLDFGTADTSKFTDDIVFAPVSRTSSAGMKGFWAIEQSITYGSTNIQILPKTAGVVDTATLLFPLASDAFEAYSNATGATLASNGLLKIDNPDSLQSLFFTIGDNAAPLEFTANAQIWPPSLNSQIGGNSSSIYLIFVDIGHPSGQGFDFINSFTFLQRFYSVFDTTHQQVGFAPTSQTFATSN